MASAYVEIELGVGADLAWQVIGDFAHGPVRMAPDFVQESRADGDVREVRFVDGAVLIERSIARDDERRRLVYGLVGGAVEVEHDNAVMQVLDDGPDRCRLVWTRDVLPHELAERLQTAMERGGAAIARRFAAS